ncbi:MAG: hypothetical protein GY906_06870 [bacterium]|nr:hypothetical protein [bacterium]
MPEQKDPVFLEDFDLTELFPVPSVSEWQAVAEASLRGRSLSELVDFTHEGIDVPPLFTDGGSAEFDAGWPGQTPFVRGSAVLGSVESGWNVCEPVSAADPNHAAKAIRTASQRGVNAIWLRCTSTLGSRQVEEFGELVTALARSPIELDLDAGGSAPAALALLVSAAQQRKINLESISGTIGFDPLGTLATDGELAIGLDRSFELAAEMVRWLQANMPQMRSLAVSTLGYHEAGATAVQEIAFTAATGVEYLRLLTARGFDLDESCCQISFVTGIGRDLFMEIAKLRALRQVWSRVVEAAGGIEASQAAPILAVTSPRTLTRRDRWVNALRTTVEALAAVTGGADSIAILPFDSALEQPGEAGGRIAVNAHALLREECSLHRVMDPAGGSWYVEHLTRQLAEKSWELFQSLERDGGMRACLLSGSIHERVAEVAALKRDAISRRRDPITGVSSFPDENEACLMIKDKAPECHQSSRQADGPTIELANLSSATAGSVLERAIDAATAGATVHQLEVAMVGGEQPLRIPALVMERESSIFDRLRDRSDAWVSEYARRPSVFVACLGVAVELRAKVSFVRGALAVGGIVTSDENASANVAEAVSAFSESGETAAVICALDSQGPAAVADLVCGLKEKGAELVLIAAPPGTSDAKWRDAGTDGYLYAGCNLDEILEIVLNSLGVSE